MKRGLVTVPYLNISPEAGCLSGIVWSLGIYSQAKSESWHLQPSKVGVLASTAKQSRRLSAHSSGAKQYKQSRSLEQYINKGALVFNEMMPSNKSGDLAPTVLELSNRLCVMQCDLSGQVNV